jgi:hypothetical protein
MKKLKKLAIIFSIMYIFLGVSELIWGSDPSSKFYFYDNILVRIGGAVLLISSIGILLKKDAARKGMLAAFILHIIELVIGIPANASSGLIAVVIIALLVFYIPMFYLAFPEKAAWSSYSHNEEKAEIAEPSLAISADSTEQRIRKELDIERRINGGSSWFYWIAGLSVVNSAILYFDGNLNFIFGLGATQLLDVYAYAFYDYYGMTAVLLGFASDALLVGLFVYLGVMASRYKTWAFIAGMILYSLDIIPFLIFGDYIGIAGHVFALVLIFKAFRALNAVYATPSTAEEIEQDVQ